MPYRPDKVYQYTIKRGDTLWDLARAHGVTVDDLLRLNPHIKNPSLIYAGRSLNLPATVRRYTIKPGDTLWELAREHGVTIRDLLRMNPHIENPNRIIAGRSLNLPIEGKPEEGDKPSANKQVMSKPGKNKSTKNKPTEYAEGDLANVTGQPIPDKPDVDVSYKLPGVLSTPPKTPAEIDAEESKQGMFVEDPLFMLAGLGASSLGLRYGIPALAKLGPYKPVAGKVALRSDPRVAYEMAKSKSGFLPTLEKMQERGWVVADDGSRMYSPQEYAAMMKAAAEKAPARTLAQQREQVLFGPPPGPALTRGAAVPKTPPVTVRDINGVPQTVPATTDPTELMRFLMQHPQLGPGSTIIPRNPTTLIPASRWRWLRETIQE